MSASPKKRKSPTKRVASTPTEESSESEYEEEVDYLENDEIENDNIDCCEPCQYKNAEIERLRKRVNELEAENAYLKDEVDTLKPRIFDYKNISADVKLFQKMTGFENKKSNYLYEFLNPGDNCENIKFYESGESAVNMDNSFSHTSSKRGPKPKIEPINQLFMFLTCLRNGFTLQFTSWLVNMPKSTVSRHIITWVNFIYFSLRSIPIWPSKQQIIDTVPDNVKNINPSTRCIIDCTELFCQRPSSLSFQSSLYSSYKHHVTYKGLVGISPSGTITFVSQLYEGSISDKEITLRCGILSSELWSSGDSLMADRGFTIRDDLKPLHVHLNKPAFLSGRDQITKDEVKESQGIASVRIHVERAIQRANL